MKKYILPIIIFLCACSSESEYTISGHIDIWESNLDDNIEIGLYPLRDYGERGLKYPIQIIPLNKNNNFNLNAEPGIYTLSITGDNIKPFQSNIIIENSKSNICINAKLSATETKFNISGFKYAEEYETILDRLRAVRSSKFEKKLVVLDSLISTSHQPSRNYLCAKKFELFTMNQIYFLYDRDSIKCINFIKSDSCIQFLNNAYDMLNEVDLLSPVIHIENSDFIRSLIELEQLVENNFVVIDRLNFNKSFFNKSISNIINNSKSEYNKSAALYEISKYLYYSSSAKALQYLEKYQNKYPNGNRIETITSMLNELSLSTGKKAPDFSVTTLNNDTLRLEDFTGKFLLLEFGSHYCPHCKAEIPYLNKLFDMTPKDKLNILYIIENSLTVNECRIYVKNNKMLFPVAISNNKIEKDFGIKYMPKVFLISPEGIILEKNSLTNDKVLRKKTLIDDINQAMTNYEFSSL